MRVIHLAFLWSAALAGFPTQLQPNAYNLFPILTLLEIPPSTVTGTAATGWSPSTTLSRWPIVALWTMIKRCATSVC